ncbi:hypothetical protein OF846_003757 [Rhodotorula toruloides]|nr:hypothetical protein OF846_003757 [Rhodotorula toruloides]
MSSAAEHEMRYFRTQVEDAFKAVQECEAAKVNTLELETRRRETLCMRQARLAEAHVELLEIEFRHRLDAANPADRREAAQECRLHVQQTAQETHRDLATLSPRLQQCVRHEKATKEEVDRFEGRGALRHRIMKSKKVALAAFIDAVHELGNMQGKEAYLKAKRDGLLSLAQVYGDAARGSVDLQAPPTYDKSRPRSARRETGLWAAEYEALAATDPRSPSVRDEAGFWAAEYEALEQRERAEHQAAGNSDPFEPGDRRSSHNSPQADREQEEIRAAAGFFTNEARERPSEEHAATHASPSHPPPRVFRPRLRLDTRDPNQRTVHAQAANHRASISRFTAALSPSIDPEAAAHIDWSNLPPSATSPIESYRAFLVPSDVQLIHTRGSSHRHARIFRPAAE